MKSMIDPFGAGLAAMQTVTFNPNRGPFIPNKHPKATPAMQKREAKKRNNIRKRSKK